MRYFLILLMSALTFCARSQSVVIPDNVARFFLEKYEENTLLKQLDTINRMRIDNLNGIITYKDSVILTYRLDSVSYQSILADKDTIISNITTNLREEIKNTERLTFQRDLGIAVGTGALLGAPLGQPIIGAAVGAGVVIFMRVIKRNRHGDK